MSQHNTTRELFGRESELERIYRCVEGVRQGKKAFLWVTGNPGMGKSSLLAKAIDHCRTMDFQIRHYACDEIGVDPFRPVESLLECKIPKEAMSDRAYLSARFSRELAALTQRSPLALFVDDVQWADYGTAMFLAHCFANTFNIKLFVFVAGRPLEDSGSIEEIEHLCQKTHSRANCGIRLGTLDETGAEELISHTLGDSVSSDLSCHVYSETAGHPFAVVHYCRALVEAQVLEGEETGLSIRYDSAISIPGEIDNLIGARLQKLNSAERSVLDCLAIFSSEVEPAAISLVSRMDELATIESLEELENCGFVHRKGTEFCLSHGLLIKAVLRRLTPLKAHAYRRAAASALERASEPNLRDLAYQYEGCNDYENAFRCLWELGRQSLSFYRGKEAGRFLDRARPHLYRLHESNSEIVCSFDLDVARAKVGIGDIKKVKMLVDRVRRFGITRLLGYRYYSLLGSLKSSEHKYGEAFSEYEKMLDFCENESDRATVHLRLAAAREGDGRIDDAVIHLRDASEELREVGGDYHVHKAIFHKAYEAFLRRKFDDCAHLLQELPYHKVNILFLRSSYYSGNFETCLESCKELLGDSDGPLYEWFDAAVYYLAQIQMVDNGAAIAMARLSSNLEYENPAKFQIWRIASLLEAYVLLEDTPKVERVLARLETIDIPTGETETIVWRARAKARAFLGQERRAVEYFQKSMDCPVLSRAGEWATSVVAYLDHSVRIRDFLTARQVAAQTLPELNRMQIPILRKKFDSLVEEVDRAAEVSDLVDVPRLIERVSDSLSVEQAVGRILGSVKEISGAIRARVQVKGHEAFGDVFDPDEEASCKKVTIEMCKKPLGTLDLAFAAPEGCWTGEQERAIQTLSRIVGILLSTNLAEDIVIKNPVNEAAHNYGLVGRSEQMERLNELIRVAAGCNETVLIQGETGTGKELVAKAIAENSDRRQFPYLSLNCGELSDDLLMSELFGHRKGSFTGADSNREGMFESADGGVLFLDEIGDASPRVQAALLRVLQNREVRRVGESRTRAVNVRVIAATNHDLVEMTRQGKFRQDLFYRLQVIDITAPPLRDHREDIPDLVHHFVQLVSAEEGRRVDGVSREAMDYLVDQEWPGNVRELENWVRSTFAETLTGGVLRLKSSQSTVELAGVSIKPLKAQVEKYESGLIQNALEKNGGNVSATAKRLEMSRSGLQKKIAKYDISKRA